jgi:hypothetical protein
MRFLDLDAARQLYLFDALQRQFVRFKSFNLQFLSAPFEDFGKIVRHEDAVVGLLQCGDNTLHKSVILCVVS